MKKNIIATFDFDGTLTTKDSLIEFIKFTHGWPALLWGIMRNLPFIVAYKLHIYSNGKAKEKLFSFFYKGYAYEEFHKKGIQFAEIIDKMVNQKNYSLLKKHQSDSHSVCVVSASIEEWVSPWCQFHGIQYVLATQVEVSEEGRLTGKFKTGNCYGQEKVRRVCTLFPDRKAFFLYAYGDSRGDKELIQFADKGEYV